MEHILSLSYGKDSLACLGVIEKLGLPLDRIIHAEIWATDTIPADLPPMIEFKAKADKIIKERYKICIENPMPLKIVGLPTETQRIQPYQFGEPWSKKTYLWLKSLPELQPTEIVKDYKPFLPSGTGRKLGGDSYGAKKCAHESKARSKTFLGIAKAMAEQWGNLNNGSDEK